MTDQQRQFFNKMAPYAQRVKAALGIPVSVTLAQWAFESGFEGTQGSHWIGGNNYSGIMGGPHGSPSKFANIDDFVNAHIKTLKNPNPDYKYTEILKATKESKPPYMVVSDVADAFANSAWAPGGQYLKNNKNQLMDIIQKYDLTSYEFGISGLPVIGENTKQTVRGTVFAGDPQIIKQGGIDKPYNPAASLPSGVDDFFKMLGEKIFTPQFWEMTGFIVVGVIFIILGAKVIITP